MRWRVTHGVGKDIVGEPQGMCKQLDGTGVKFTHVIWALKYSEPGMFPTCALYKLVSMSFSEEIVKH